MTDERLINMNSVGGKYRSSTTDTNTQNSTELVALRDVAKRMKRTLKACEQFIESLNNKGMTFNYTDRTAASLVLRDIKEFTKD